MNWQRSHVEAAAAYFLEMIEAGADDVRTRSVYEGLLDVLEPTRYAARMQSADVAASASAATARRGYVERRSRVERRGHTDRRLVNLGPLAAGERRSGPDRRALPDRRSR